MVQSKINKEINYTDSEKINDIDKGASTSLYKLFLFNIHFIISLGKIQKKYIDDDIIFAPIYFIVDSKTIKKIGVYEFKQNKYADMLDDDGELNIDLLGDPLLFSFVTEKYIQKKLQTSTFLQEISDDDIMSESLDNTMSEDVVNDEKELELKPTEKTFFVEFDDNVEYKGETKNMNAKIEKKYKKSSIWVSNYFKNNNYGLIDNEGCGDCFFATIRDAFKTVGINLQVSKLRSMLSDDAIQSDYDNYMDNFNMYKKIILENTSTIKNYTKLIKKKKSLASKYTKYKETVKEKDDVNEVLAIKNKAKKTKIEYNDINKQLKQIGNINEIKEDLLFARDEYNNVKFMKDVKNLSDFKEILKTQKYWADSWSIQKLELLLNVKIIVLSSLKYEKGDYENILSCNSFTAKKIEEGGIFNPKYYIIVDHTGEHYKLVTYKGVNIFRFHELPYKLVQLVIKKCMMSNGKTMYNYIPKFAKEIGIEINVDMGKDIVEKKTMEDVVDSTDKSTKKVESKKNEEIMDESAVGMGKNKNDEEFELGMNDFDSLYYDEE
tara:strand:- start:8825 stop:10471 length:1647 start_codon:yes stop_codon:yes gene_type:complete